MYRIYKNNNKKNFLETESFTFAKIVARQESERGDHMEIRENRNGRWYRVEVSND